MTEEEYWRALRAALRALYDPVALRRNPLNELLHPADETQGLQHILMEAIQQLSPARGLSVQSDARRTFQILQHRYVEQFGQEEVAASLGLSSRQLRRQEQLAIRVLGEQLRTRYGLAIVQGELGSAVELPPEEEESAGDDSATLAEELEWLQHAAPHEELDIEAMLADALHTLEPLFRELHLEVSFQPAQESPHVVVKAMAFRQAVMITLAALARRASGSTLHLEVQNGAGEVRVLMRAAAEVEFPEVEGDELKIARQLLELTGARLASQPRSAGEGATIAIVLPMRSAPTLLVIDDNQDVQQLLQRYLTGTPWRLVATREPVEGIALARQLLPRLILLDVMMPGMDGWSVLTRLRRDEITQETPVIICTILPEEQLARTLGAAGFLRKPVAREELLAVLERYG